MEAWQALGGVGAGRTATVVIVAFFAVLSVAGCRPEKPAEKPVEKPVVVVAAGDIATCSGTGDEATAKLVGGIDGMVLTLGDEAYPAGSDEDFDECYEPSWGRFEDRTKPVPGNHEYYTEGAEGYFDYFGKAAGDPDEGYYSYDLGEWHLIALNSNCNDVGGCGAYSPRLAGLRQTSPPTTTGGAPWPTFTTRTSAPGKSTAAPPAGAAVGGPLRSGSGRGPLRTRPQLRTLRTAGSVRESGPRAGHQGVRGGHRWQEPLQDL